MPSSSRANGEAEARPRHSCSWRGGPRGQGPGKHGAELREEKPKRRELDGGLPALVPPDSGSGKKRRAKRARPGKHGAELREEKPKRRELDGGLPALAPSDSGSGGLDDEALVMSVSQRKMAIQCRVQLKIINTESGAVEAAQPEKQSNVSFQGLEQSGEDDIEDEYNTTDSQFISSSC